MANSTTNIDTLVQGQGSPEVSVNAGLDAMSQAATYGRRASQCSGLTWGYYGGNVSLRGGSMSQIANGTLTLTPSATNYVVAHKDTGAVSLATATTNWNNLTDYWRLYQIVAGAATATSYTDAREAALFQGSDRVAITAFTGLTDTPANYTGAGGKAVRVKADMTGLEFTDDVVPLNAQIGTSYVLQVSDAGKEVEMTNGSANTVEIPLNATAQIPIGSVILVSQGGTGTTSITVEAGVTVKRRSTLTANLAGQEAIVTLHKVGANTWRCSGEFAAV